MPEHESPRDPPADEGESRQVNYDLHDLYSDESTVQRYTRLTVGEGASLFTLAWHELLLGLCTGLPGIPGLGLRGFLYHLAFPGFARGAFVGRNVTLRCPRQVHLDEGVVVDDFVQLVATSRRRDAITVGTGTMLRSFAMVNAGPPEGFVHIGSHCGIGQGTILYGNGGLSIGDRVLIAGQCFLVASSHNFTDPTRPIAEQGYSATGIVIEDNVWIGAGAKILDGVTIGAGAIVGSNAVVTRSVSPGARVVGIPARVLEPSANPDA